MYKNLDFSSWPKKVLIYLASIENLGYLGSYFFRGKGACCWSNN